MNSRTGKCSFSPPLKLLCFRIFPIGLKVRGQTSYMRSPTCGGGCCIGRRWITVAVVYRLRPRWLRLYGSNLNDYETQIRSYLSFNCILRHWHCLAHTSTKNDGLKDGQLHIIENSVREILYICRTKRSVEFIPFWANSWPLQFQQVFIERINVIV